MTTTRTAVETQSKKTVTVIGFTLAADLRSVLEKHAESIGKNIDVVGVTAKDLRTSSFMPKKDTLTICNPILEPGASTTYSVDMGTKLGTLHFLSDRLATQFLKNTQHETIYVGGDIDPTVRNAYIALVIFDEMVILTDLLSDKSQISDGFIKKAILCQLIKVHENWSKEGALQRRLLYDRAILNNYMHFVGLLKDNSKHALKDKMRSLQQDLNNHWMAINKREKELREAQTLYTSIARRLSSNKQDTENAAVSKMLEPLLVSGKYTGFTFNAMKIVGTTGEIELENHGKKFKIGRFSVEVNIDGNLFLRNITEVKDGGYDHPHILEGRACLGNIKEMVSTMILNFNFLPLFDLLHKYLCSYNEEGPYTKLERAWGKEEDWCGNCEHPSADCHCNRNRNRNTCHSCNEERNDCECDRCPESGDLMRDVDCEDCDYCHDEDGRCTY